MKKLTSILALSTLAFSISAMANSTDFGTAADNFIDSHNARSAFGTYSQVDLNGINCSGAVVPAEGYELSGGATICYDGLQNLKDGTAYIEYTQQSLYGDNGPGYLVYLKDKLTNVNVKLTDKAGNNVPASTLNLEGVYDSQDGNKTVIFLKSQDPLYNGDNTMNGQISISGTVVGVDAALANAEFESAVKQVSKDALNEDMQKLGFFAGSAVDAIGLFVDDKTQTALTGYATTDDLPDVSGFASLSDLPDLSGYALITQLPDLSAYAKSSEIPSLDGYALKSELPNLSPYALKSEIPSVAGLATTAYVSTIKDLASNADTKAQQALNTANAIDLQSIIDRVNDLENKVEELSSKVPVADIRILSYMCDESSCPLTDNSNGISQVEVRSAKWGILRLHFSQPMENTNYKVFGKGTYTKENNGWIVYERAMKDSIQGNEPNRTVNYVDIFTHNNGIGDNMMSHEIDVIIFK